MMFQDKGTPKHVLKITMLGPTGVGKTSLLAAMYRHFEETIGLTNLQLRPDQQSSAILQQRLEELQSLVGESIRVRKGITSTDEARSFIFDLGKKGATPSLRLQFQDYPGNDIEYNSNTPERVESVENFLRESVAVLIAIDAPALMEPNQQGQWKGQWHEQINKPLTITTLFKKAYENLDSPKLVILAPVKCEKYLQNHRDTNELLNRIRDKYASLLQFLKCDTLIPNVAVVVTPIQTVGSVVFSYIKVEDGEPRFYFRKPDPDVAYSPKDSEQPLRYLLRFLLTTHLQQQRWPIFNFLRSWFGQDKALREAIGEFAKGCNKDRGFSVLQGANLLKIEGK